ncbi:MAG: hypothetical protein LBQ88_06100 [Treponema sp.]|jgi:hypothetical protein|nr:hypothetical protein [Treponema sp.]
MEANIIIVVLDITIGERFSPDNGAFFGITIVSGPKFEERSTLILLFTGDKREHGQGFLLGLILALYNAGGTGQSRYIGFFIPEFSIPD